MTIWSSSAALQKLLERGIKQVTQIVEITVGAENASKLGDSKQGLFKQREYDLISELVDVHGCGM